ncbi:MAG: glycosyltransferase, partial [Candidatus Sulfomarinibacteraceae bacterium]
PPGADGAATRARFAGGRPYVLHLGTIEPRKGVTDLVTAWERLAAAAADTPDLVIAGKPGWQTEPIFDRIKTSPLASRIHLPGYVSREEARELMRHASVFVLASEAEGFGLPLAEAVSCGTPAVASDIPVLREAGGDAALYSPVGDPDALAGALARALDPDVAARLRARAAERAPELRWEPVVDAWVELLERVVASRRG